jgi:ATP phosphoribosyltransferase regulatory subunit
MGEQLLARVGDRSESEIRRLCDEYGLDGVFTEKLAGLAGLYGAVSERIYDLRALSVNDETDSAIEELEQVCRIARRLGASGDMNIDFSIVNDMNYYSGITFQGFIEGIPAAVLSGGRYDKLLRRFGKFSGAIGFAVYADMLEGARGDADLPDADVLLLRGEGDDPLEIADAVRDITNGGESVCVVSESDDMKHGRLVRLSERRGAGI